MVEEISIVVIEGKNPVINRSADVLLNVTQNQTGNTLIFFPTHQDVFN